MIFASQQDGFVLPLQRFIEDLGFGVGRGECLEKIRILVLRDFASTLGILTAAKPFRSISSGQVAEIQPRRL